MEGLFLFIGVTLAMFITLFIKKKLRSPKDFLEKGDLSKLEEYAKPEPDEEKTEVPDDTTDMLFRVEEREAEYEKPKFKKNKAIVDSSNRKIIMGIVVSLIVLIAALYIILSQQLDDENQKWAFSTVGAVLGYWLNS